MTVKRDQRRSIARSSHRLAVLGAVALALIAVGCGSGNDNSSSSSKTTAGGLTVTTAAPGTTVDVALGDTNGLNGMMTMTPTPTSVPAGNVTFVVKNNGTIDHEMIVLKTDTPFDQVPVTDAGDPPAKVTTGADKVDEGTSVGETGDPNLKPGETRTFTIKDMKAGNYVLVCNIAKHYQMGMRAAFKVS